jgi:hypothetical protein
VQADNTRDILVAHALPLREAGQIALVEEARNHDFFLLGELHGETNIPDLLAALWPRLWDAGYHHAAAEVSPWAAQLLQSPSHDGENSMGLWTREQSSVVRQFAAPEQNVLWGCDIEENRPDELIREMARVNPDNSALQEMVRITARGYKREQASDLLRLAESAKPGKDESFNGISLWRSIHDTLAVEALRSSPGSRLSASNSRERVMKELFLAHYRQEPGGKVFLRFGRNHLHRGYDARGVSTLGNFVAEWALSQGKTAFNVGAFAAGGKEHLGGKTFDADERQDELTFAVLADLANGKDTLFDLRPLRPVLHAIPADKRSPLQVNLVYWSDSYDFLICYPVASPLGG